jgi:hypothetical protein
LQSTRRKDNSGAFAGVFLSLGILLLAFSMLMGMQIAAFAGLGLTLWGAIFALARNGRYVESNFLDGNAKSAYSTLGRIIEEMHHDGHAFYIPPYPQDANLPDYMKNLKEPVVFIGESFDGKPSVDELTAGKFLSQKNHGMFIVSPGSSILTQMENELKREFNRTSLEELSYVVPRILAETRLAKRIEIRVGSDGTVNLKVTGSVYESVYSSESTKKSSSMLGCPIVSAVATAIAKASGKTVIIKELALTPHGSSVNVVFSVL